MEKQFLSLKSQIIMLGVITCVLSFVFACYHIKSVDAGWHLKYGEKIVKEKKLLHKDIFSYTAYGREYPTTHWLFQIIIYLVDSCFGIKGLIITKAFWYVVLYLLFYSLMIRFDIHPFISFILVTLTAFGSINRMAIRPQSISYMGFVIYLFILLIYRQRDSVLVWSLPVIAVIWSNTHAGVIFGASLIFFFLLGEAVKKKFAVDGSFPECQISPKTIIILIPVGLLTGLSTLITPSGIKLYAYLFDHLDIYERLKLQEFQTPSPYHFPIFYFFIIAITIMTVIKYKKNDITLLLIAVIFIKLAISSVRLIPYSLFIMAFYIAYKINFLYKDFIYNKKLLVYKKIVYLPTILLVVLLSLFLKNKMHYRMAFEFDNSSFPVQAVKFLKENPIPGRMYNSCGIGGYLIWTYPEKKVYSDGRMQIYNDIINRDLFHVLEFDYNPLSSKFIGPKVDEGIWFCVCKHSSLRDSLPRNKWAFVYFDQAVQIYVRRPPVFETSSTENNDFYSKIKNYIKKYELKYLYSKNQKIIPVSPVKYYNKKFITKAMYQRYNLLVLNDFIKSLCQNSKNWIALNQFSILFEKTNKYLPLESKKLLYKLIRNLEKKDGVIYLNYLKKMYHN